MTGAAPHDRGALPRRLGLVFALLPACARAVTTHDPLPGWSLDPLTTVAPLDGLGPAGDMLLGVLCFLGLALVLAGAARARERVPIVPLLLGTLGLVPVLYHAWLGPGASVENARAGAVWGSAVAGGLAALVACRHGRERALALAACAAIVGPLFFRAAVQVYSEHPVLVEDFKNRREEILAAHGWTADSAMARGYERRLSQPDASAWFAMSNVYASVMAACVAPFAAAVLAALRGKLWSSGSRYDRYTLAGAVAGLVLAAGGLFLAVPAGGSPSKGAVAAMALGLGLVALPILKPRLPPAAARLLRGEVIGVGVVALALGAILARGLVGERLGELSLLFRWYYIQAAVRIFTEHTIWGVGPADFQGAYLLAKNPLNPEEVASPHSVLFEYLSTLGVLGLAWCALLVLKAALAGRRLVQAVPEGAGERTAGHLAAVGWLAAIVLPCAALSFGAEALPLARSVPDAAALLLFDGLVKTSAWLLLWLGLGAALLALAGSPLLRAGLGAGALALLAHSQIELTATDVGAAAWVFVLLGAAAASTAIPAASKTRAAVLASSAAAGLAVLTLVAAAPVTRWQGTLRSASRSVSEVTSIHTRFMALGREGARTDPRPLVEELSAAAGRPVSPSPEAVVAALAQLRADRTRLAADELEALARAGEPPSRAVAHVAFRTRATLSALLRQTRGDPAKPLQDAREIAVWAARQWPNDSRAWRDLAQIEAALAETGLAEPGAEIEALLRAASLDPFSPDLAWRIATRLAETGRDGEARTWAERALANHAWRRLDPLSGLSDPQARGLRELLGIP